MTIPKHSELGEFKGFVLNLKRFYADGESTCSLGFILERFPELETLLAATLEAIDRLCEAMPDQEEDSDPPQGTPQGMRIGISGSGGSELLGLLALCGALDDGSTPSPGSEEKEDSHPPASGDGDTSSPSADEWESLTGLK